MVPLHLKRCAHVLFQLNLIKLHVHLQLVRLAEVRGGNSYVINAAENSCLTNQSLIKIASSFAANFTTPQFLYISCQVFG